MKEDFANAVSSKSLVMSTTTTKKVLFLVVSTARVEFFGGSTGNALNYRVKGPGFEYLPLFSV